jgi:hypothetical protein
MIMLGIGIDPFLVFFRQLVGGVDRMQQVLALGKRPHVVVSIVDPINLTAVSHAKGGLLFIAALSIQNSEPISSKDMIYASQSTYNKITFKKSPPPPWLRHPYKIQFCPPIGSSSWGYWLVPQSCFAHNKVHEVSIYTQLTQVAT